MSKNPAPSWLRIHSDQSSAIHNRVTEGFLRKAQELQCPFMVERAETSQLVSMSTEGCRGLCGIFSNQADHSLLRSLQIPVINFSNIHGKIDGVGNLLSDDVEIGRLAAEHLMAKGYQHFMTVGESTYTYSIERAGSFRDTLLQKGNSCRRELHDFESLQKETFVEFTRHVSEDLGNRLAEFPLESAIFATNDWVAMLIQHVIITRFPERQHTTAVLGVDDDQSSWWYLGPLAGLSSVRPSFHAIGRAAMDWFLEHPNEKTAASLFRRFGPEGVVERASTAGGACADPFTARVLRWAWQEMQEGWKIQVSDLTSHFHLSRRTLDRKFEKYVGQSAGSYLQSQRLNYARHLLRCTPLRIGEISQRCGFTKQDTLSTRFKKTYGMTPRDYRKQLLSEAKVSYPL